MDILPPTTNLFLFLTATLALLLMPGPAVLYIVARTIDQGRQAGLISVLGIEIGNSVHALGAAVGVSAILLSSALAFSTVKYLGAAYLVFLGIRKLTAHDEAPGNLASEPQNLNHTFAQAIVVAVLNPKTALFFLAFFPQFVDHAAGSALGQTLFLGILFVTLATVTDSFYALLAGTTGRWLRNNQRFWRFQRYFAGTVYIGLGVTAAISGTNKK
jgi:threonine/homoserine/homoserine lactone efflux protein